ncbi:MAG: ANTAR domain-containing protein [Kineosporiaceae bacterium]
MIGALNLFTRADVRLEQDDLAVGQALADVATIGLLHERNLREQTVLSEQLQGALQTRVLVEQAKGMVAARSGITVTEAFERLRRHARRNGITLTSVAARVVEGSFDVDVPLGS